MGQIVFTKELRNYDTGEVVEREIYRKQVANKEQFVRTYIEDIGALARCSSADKSVVLCTLKYLDYATNELILTPDRRKEIALCGGISVNTINSSVSRLMKKNILIKKSGNTYILNPKIFFYGKDIDRATVLKATITYIIDRPVVEENGSITVQQPQPATH